MRTALVVLLLFAFSAIADTAIPLSSDLFPVHLVAAADGTVWYAAYRQGQLVTEHTEVGRVLPNGVVEKLTNPGGVRIDAYGGALALLPDGAVAVASHSGRIIKVDRELKVTHLTSGNGVRTIFDMTYAADGSLWFVGEADDYTAYLGRVSRGGALERFAPLYGSHAIASAPDGHLYVAGYNSIYRVTMSGELAHAATCDFTPRWIEAASDGTVWTEAGRLLPDGSFVRHSFGGRRAVQGSDGNMWITADTALRAYAKDGSFVREVPFPETPLSLASSGDLIWYGVRGGIRRFDVKTQVDLPLRLGDIASVELKMVSAQIWYWMLALHHRGEHPFMRRPLRSPDHEHHDAGVFALDASRILVEQDDDDLATDDIPIAMIVDGEGVLHGVLDGPLETLSAGIVVDRSGRIHALRMNRNKADYRLLTYGPNGGPLLRDVAVPLPEEDVNAIDLAADQCTLHWASYRGRSISRFDICTGALLSDVVSELPDWGRDLRILPDGDILLVFRHRVVRFRPDGSIAKEYAAPHGEELHSIALDLDPAYFWVGGGGLDAGGRLWRIRLATGEVVEDLPSFSYPSRITVIGEPRAARAPMRRRATRR